MRRVLASVGLLVGITTNVLTGCRGGRSTTSGTEERVAREDARADARLLRVDWDCLVADRDASCLRQVSDRLDVARIPLGNHDDQIVVREDSRSRDELSVFAARLGSAGAVSWNEQRYEESSESDRGARAATDRTS